MTFVSDYLLSVLIACLIILICILIKKKLEYFSSRGIPYINPINRIMFRAPTFSALSDFSQEVYVKEKDKGIPCIGFFLTYLKPSILVLDPALVESILIKDFSHFHDHGFEVDPVNDPLLCHLFNMKGDEWRVLRNKLLPTFTSGKLKGMVPTMDKCAQELVDEMKQDINLRKDTNLRELFKSYTLSVIASCVFSIDPKNIKDPDCEFRRTLNMALTPKYTTLMQMAVFMLFPKLHKLLKMKFVPQEVETFFLKLTKDALAIRKKSGIKRNDFVQLLVELKEKGSVQVDVRDLEEDEKKHVQQAAEAETPNNKLEMTDELLAAQAFVFIVGGYDNTAFAAAVTTYFLGKHKDIQQRVREEVREALSKHGGMNYPALKDMRLLDASINEALRLQPALPILLRGCNKNFPLSTGETLEKDIQLVIPMVALQKDSNYWPDPDKYDPERFLSGDITPGTYLPFGDGPRICIAQRLALLMVKLILAQVIVNFEMQPSSKTKEPLKPTFILNPDIVGGLWSTFHLLQE